LSQEQKFDTGHLEDLVARRAKIGTLLLELWKVSTHHQSTLWHLLLGVGFSLWRAAFLIARDRPRPTMDEDAKDFLGLLLRDNAINYPQDRQTRAWTGGYYLNNANLRLVIVKDLIPLSANESAVVDKILRSVENQKQISDHTPDLQTGWEDAYAAADIALGKLRETLGS